MVRSRSRSREAHGAASLDSPWRERQGGWVPSGGGVRMCPGRFFAKNQMMAALAMICTKFDIELRMSAGWKPERNARYYPVGALPPKGEIPFRIWRKAVA